MELYEYQTKSLLARFGVSSPPHTLVEVGSNIEGSVSKFGFESLLVKPQSIGPQKAPSYAVSRPKELVQVLKEILGSSSPEDAEPKTSKVMVMSVPSIVKKYQLAIALTPNGEVEVRAREEGGKFFTEYPFEGFIRGFQLNRISASLGIHGSRSHALKKTLDGALSAFFHFDALRLDIDSLALTENGIFQALDARMMIDDLALYRQPELMNMRDFWQKESSTHSLPCIYLEQEGEVGCLGNGIGLALATADLVCLFEGTLGMVVDIGRDIEENHLANGLKNLQKKNHKVLCVNLFTGLIGGEKIARIIKNDLSHIPMVVRLEGTNAATARRLLKECGPMCIVVESLDEMAQQVVGFVTMHTGS